jgi:hypothetical protein
MTMNATITNLRMRAALLVTVPLLATLAPSRARAEAPAEAPRDDGPRGIAVTVHAAYAPNNDAFGDGEGLRLGYALPLDSGLAVDLGVFGINYAGTNNVVPGVSFASNPQASTPTAIDSLAVLLYGADFGVHLRHGIVSLKPYISAGFGWVNGRACLGSACVTTINEQHPFVAPGAALQITAARHYITGIDFRYVFMPVNSVNVTTQAYSLFVGYQF